MQVHQRQVHGTRQCRNPRNDSHPTHRDEGVNYATMAIKYGTLPEKATTGTLWSQVPTHRVMQASIDTHMRLYKYRQPITLKLYANNMTVVEYNTDHVKYYYKDYAHPLCMPARGKYAAIHHKANDVNEPTLKSQPAAKQVRSPSALAYQRAHRSQLSSYGNARTGTAATSIPLHQVNTASRRYCHTQGIIVKPRIIILQGVKAPHHCKRLTATCTDSTSAPTRVVRYDAVQPATTLTVQSHKTIPYTKCTTECQHKLGTYARLSTRQVKSRLSPSSLKTQPKLSLTWEVQSKPLSSLEVQHGTFMQPTKARLIDSVPDTCKKDYEAITMSFKQGWSFLSNQPMIKVMPHPDQ